MRRVEKDAVERCDKQRKRRVEVKRKVYKRWSTEAKGTEKE